MILAISFVGEDGYIRDDAPGEWLFVAIIPIILGMIIFFIPISNLKKNMCSYQNLGRTRMGGFGLRTSSLNVQVCPK